MLVCVPVFVAGCGKFFEGNGAQFARIAMDVLPKLVGDTYVFCGHEYTIDNAAFASFVEPNNAKLKTLVRLMSAHNGNAATWQYCAVTVLSPRVMNRLPLPLLPRRPASRLSRPRLTRNAKRTRSYAWTSLLCERYVLCACARYSAGE